MIKAKLNIDNFLNCFCEHKMKNNGTASVVIRVVSYTVALFTFMYLGKRWMLDSYVWTISSFTTFAFVFELLWMKSKHEGARMWSYIICVIALGFSGLYLTNEAIHVRKETRHREVFNGRLNDMLEETPGVIIITDEAGRIKACSDETLKLLDYQENELVGQSVSMIFPSEISQSRIDLRKKVGQELYSPTGNGWYMKADEEIYLKSKNGNEILVTMFVFGIRYSVDDKFPDDIQFFSLAIRK